MLPGGHATVEYDVRLFVLQPLIGLHLGRVKVRDPIVVELPPTSATGVTDQADVMSAVTGRTDVPHDGVRVVEVRWCHRRVRCRSQILRLSLLLS